MRSYGCHDRQLEFDAPDYDARSDLRAGNPTSPLRRTPRPEGHAVDFDADDSVTGMLLVSVRWLMDREGELRVRGRMAT